jgi:hypothetical protein
MRKKTCGAIAVATGLVGLLGYGAFVVLNYFQNLGNTIVLEEQARRRADGGHLGPAYTAPRQDE